MVRYAKTQLSVSCLTIKFVSCFIVDRVVFFGKISCFLREFLSLIFDFLRPFESLFRFILVKNPWNTLFWNKKPVFVLFSDDFWAQNFTFKNSTSEDHRKTGRHLNSHEHWGKRWRFTIQTVKYLYRVHDNITIFYRVRIPHHPCTYYVYISKFFCMN